MGCGASTPAQGTSPLLAGAEQSAANQEGRNNTAAPIAEDIQAVQDQGPKEAGQPAGAQAARATPGGGPSSALADKPGAAPGASAAAAPGGEGQSQSGDGAERLVLGGSAVGPERTTPSTGGLDPAVTPSSQTATVTLLPEVAGFVPRPRYTQESELSMASTSFDLSGRGDDSEEDELASMFTIQAWKRYYSYNKKKHHDLLTYFWRKFQPEEYSCFCISYRDQDLLITTYMAENCINGFCARVEDLGFAENIFLQMYTLHDFECDQYRIVGLLVVQGQSLPPQLAALTPFDGFVYHKADTTVTLIKQFVSALLIGKSPLNSLQLLSGKEIV